MPSHGHARFLPERLASITGQTRPPDELVIIDDGSRDESATWLRQWRSPLPLHLECRTTTTGNPFAVWNAGATRALGDWLWIAESDDTCHPAMLAALLDAAECHPDAAIVFCQSELMDEAGTVRGTFVDYTAAYDSESWRLDFALEGPTAVARHLLARNTIPNVSACLISRCACVAIGGAEVSLNLCGDWLTYARLLRHGSLVFLAAPLNRYRQHSDTQRARTRHAEHVRQGYVARRMIATLHDVSEAECEFARRFAWSEAAALGGVEPTLLPQVLGPEAHAAAVVFDPSFDARAGNPAKQTWNHCDAFFEPSARFSPANQRRLPVVHYNSWHTYRFRSGHGRVRLDPTNSRNPCAIREIALIDPADGRAFWTANAGNQFAGITSNPDVRLSAREQLLHIECCHDDPQLFLPAAATAARNRFDLVVEIRHAME